MRLDRIVCLANSYKHDNRCVAGISLVTRKWVRLIGRKVPRCLTRSEVRCSDGREVSLLDVFEVEVEADCGSHYHPEDVLIAGSPWRRVRRFDKPADVDLLKSAVQTDAIVLQVYGHRIAVHEFQDTPARVSLSLLEPEDLRWRIQEIPGKRRYRANFLLGPEGRTQYDLPVTDPEWLDQLNLLPDGIHPHRLLCGNRLSQTFLTASLSEPYEGFHYKLVAGVIVMPAVC